MPHGTPSQDCPDCGRFVQDRPNRGLRCECGWTLPRTFDGSLADRWVPVFNADLSINGGFAPGYGGDGAAEARARAAQVRDAALNGRLPATLDGLETTPSNLLD